jgi:hypothetical protein
MWQIHVTLLQVLIWKILSNLNHLQLLLWIPIIFKILPTVAARPEESSFPDIPFQAFSQFIQNNFSSKISLSTVLVLLFTMTDNPDLLNLHARQQNPKYTGEKHVAVSSWMKCLAREIDKKLYKHVKLLRKSDNVTETKTRLDNIGIKLDALAKLLDLNPYDDNGQFQQKLKPISHQSIQPIHIICPDSYESETLTCQPQSLLQITKIQDIPSVTLIKGFQYYGDVPVLTGKCPSCQTSYHADHERTPVSGEQGRFDKLYLNSAKYIKAGQNIWVDRLFSNLVLSAMYSFHASAAAIAEFWNNTFWTMLSETCPKLSQCQTWHVFVQESIRALASASGINLVLQDGLAINEVTKEAFQMLGQNGIIQAADQHTCSECTHKYKSTSDLITTDDPAALVGTDDNTAVPALVVNEDAGDAIQEQRQSTIGSTQTSRNDDDMDVDYSPVKLVVVDGIVMGPNVCILTITCN